MWWNCDTSHCCWLVSAQMAGCITWKESLAGERGAMGLSVLQKWMVEGSGLGVNRTGVWTKQGQKNGTKSETLGSPHPHTQTQTGERFTRAWEVMTDGVSVLVADPGASKLFTAAFTYTRNRILCHWPRLSHTDSCYQSCSRCGVISWPAYLIQ